MFSIKATQYCINITLIYRYAVINDLSLNVVTSEPTTFKILY